MSSLSPRPMKLFLVEFQELYARHLCRHSQRGINVAHLIALFATWYALYGLLVWITAVEWVLAVPALVYLAVLAVNLPVRVLAATALFLAMVIAAVLWFPAPWWVYAAMIPVFYKLQSWSHRVYTVETDMTEFNRKYQKGGTLFVILLIYEVPIVLHFLWFDRRITEVRVEPIPQEEMVARGS